MFYNFDITVPANTAVTSLLKSSHKICHGICHKVDLVFPPGCAGLTGIKIYDNTHQIWPTNVGAYFKSDGETISWREHLPFLVEPFEIYSYCYNVDDTYDHVITLRVGVLPIIVLAPWLLSYTERLAATVGE